MLFSSSEEVVELALHPKPAQLLCYLPIALSLTQVIRNNCACKEDAVTNSPELQQPPTAKLN